MKRLGYQPKPITEGHSVTFAELQEQDYTGIGISCGGGMFNVCLSYKCVPAVSFSTSRGGDWIDQNVAESVGMASSLACASKEGGVDLNNPRNRVEEAIGIYYRELIQYTLKTISERFESQYNLPAFTRPVELVLCGGTSLVKGFIEIFEQELKHVNLQIEISKVRLARDPLKTVAHGCLQAAIEELKARPSIEKPA